MNYLLYQPAKLPAPDCVYKNGNLITEEPLRTEIYDKIIEITAISSGKPYPYVEKSHKYWVLRGLFDAKDEKGRTLAFIFASDTNDYINELNLVCKNIGYSLLPKTDEAINSYTSKKKLFEIFVTGVMSLIILTIVIILTKRTCK